MQNTAIVPKDELASSPLVRIHKFRPGNQRVEFFDESSTFVIAHSLDEFGHVAQVDGVPARFRMNSKDRMFDRWKILYLLGGQRRRIPSLLMKLQMMDRFERGKRDFISSVSASQARYISVSCVSPP